MDRVSGALPGFDSALERLHVGKALFPIFGCLTGSASLGGSGSIEDDFLRLRQRAHLELEAGKQHGSVQVESPALSLVLVSAHQQRLARFYFSISFLNWDSWNVCHAPPYGAQWLRFYSPGKGPYSSGDNVEEEGRGQSHPRSHTASQP